MIAGKKITRRKPGSGPSINYFTSDTQDAIVEYKGVVAQTERDLLYRERISPAFKALVENLINVYKFQIQHESKEDLRSECVDFLYTVIPKFDPLKGSKAFSYFNVVAKNWLTIKSKQNSKMVQSFSSLDDVLAFSEHEKELIENYNILPAPDELITHEEYVVNIRKMISEIKSRVATTNESSCVEAIELIFSNAEELDFDSKRAIMVYIRNITKLSPKQLSIVLSGLKKHYKTIKNEEMA